MYYVVHAHTYHGGGSADRPAGLGVLELHKFIIMADRQKNLLLFFFC